MHNLLRPGLAPAFKPCPWPQPLHGLCCQCAMPGLYLTDPDVASQRDGGPDSSLLPGLAVSRLWLTLSPL